MKKILLTLFTLMATVTLWAQAPQRLSYQSIVRDGSNVVVASTAVGIKISVVRGTGTGPAVYVETHRKTTNTNGLVSLEIGEGTALTGRFVDIDWANGPYLIRTETDPTGGTNYSITGIAPLNSVPYALYAANGTPGPKGDKGDTGATGTTGAAGPAGVQGPIGLTGLQGPTGPQGVVGLPGEPGLAGATGPQGPIGLTGPGGLPGATGAQGPIGLTGLQGAIGQTGPAGPQGIPGVAGPQGPSGPAGATGSAGIDGAVGATGPQGVAGLLTGGSAAGNTPFWDGTQWVVNSSNLFNNGGNVGIGTAVPSEKLAITGNLKASGTVTAGSVTYPNTHGSANQVLSTTGTGTLTWTTPAAGVPYTGAMQAVDLGAYDLKVNGLTVGRGSGSIVENTATGSSALFNNTLGNGNTATGSSALFNNTTGNGNTASGADALKNNTTGSTNTASGQRALYSNTSGSENTASGRRALYANTTGNSNTGSGYDALLANTTGTTNTASGASALSSNTTGNGNTAMGYNSLLGNTTGSNNTAIGNGANIGSGSLTNATALGNGAIVAVSNTIQLGNTSVTNVKTSGTVTAGAVTYPIAHGATGQVLTTNGSGTLSWTAGLPSSGNTAGDMLYWNGSAWVKVAAGSNGQTLTFYNGAPVWTGTISYANTVVSGGGRVWMDRNLGASRVATSSTDHLAYGSLYQWGRGSDGHELMTWSNATTGTAVNGTLNILSTNVKPNHGKFITSNTSNWLSTDNANLWQGVNGINNPCPNGFRIPTRAEWEVEISSWSGTTAANAFSSPLKLTVAGGRDGGSGSVGASTENGHYWSSTSNGGQPAFEASICTSCGDVAQVFDNTSVSGFSVRCIKD